MRTKTSKAQLSFTEEIFVDNFAGGGGASTGIELAIGRPVTIAINHDPDAIAMHKANHPYTEHYQESVWDIDPKEVCRGRPVALAWFSPDCKHFSRAKGGKPVDKTIRGLAWVAVRWARYVHPRVIMLENVPEFQTWGPLGKDNKPIKSRSGETFRKFIRHLQKEGYEVKWQELRACDYGAPTIRKRFFLVARCDGQPINFPTPTHGNGKGLIPYHTAAECIDWSIPCKSIFERKRPLAEATLRRISRGLDKFTIKSLNPYIIPIGYGERKGQQPRVNDIKAPLSTIVSKGKHCISAPHISKYYSGITGSAITNPMPTVTAIDHNSLVASQLIQYHSETTHSEARGQSLTEPLMTVDSSPRYGLTSAHIVKYYSGDHYSGADAPLHTITTKDRNALAESHLCVLRKNMDCKALTEPLPTITTSAGHFAQITTRIVKYKIGENLGHWEEVRELLNKYCAYELAEDDLLLLQIGSEDYYIDDIGLRMLEPRELYKAQGFPEDYIIDTDCTGKSYPRDKQVARCGNAVPPPFAEALVRANLPEYCERKFTTMQELKESVAM